MCKHNLEDLMGVEGGVICRKCGKFFDHIPKQEAQTIAPVQPEQAPAKKKSIRKTAAKKGDK